MDNENIRKHRKDTQNIGGFLETDLLVRGSQISHLEKGRQNGQHLEKDHQEITPLSYHFGHILIS